MELLPGVGLMRWLQIVINVEEPKDEKAVAAAATKSQRRNTTSVRPGWASHFGGWLDCVRPKQGASRESEQNVDLARYGTGWSTVRYGFLGDMGTPVADDGASGSSQRAFSTSRSEQSGYSSMLCAVSGKLIDAIDRHTGSTHP
ncbi:hypothetical protein V494_08030 [Pseudogymnoascus sp. VKM F-4513 (FW-928)]|nr:hypothetical protein V494_08030 [Pseudogymnoascus sp. VKM F-4513 (FW-928)]